MSDDSFRSTDWSPEAQGDFEARLRRARDHNKLQYMRIKGLALRAPGEVDAARLLWQRVLDSEMAYDFEKASTLEHLADSYAQTDTAEAERYYRTVLTEHPDMNGTTHTIELSLAELLLERGDRASHDEAAVLLESWIEHRGSPFPSVLFRFHLALIRVADALGDKETVQRAARTALDLTSRGPVFPRHRDVGLVRPDRKTLKRLEKLAR